VNGRPQVMQIFCGRLALSGAFALVFCLAIGVN
jgi:hypothetical protein